MTTMNLLTINRSAEKQLRLQRQIRITTSLAEARQVGIPLKSRYEWAAKSLAQQFYALKMQYLSKPIYNGFARQKVKVAVDTLSPKSVFGSPKTRKLSVTAKAFTPQLTSDDDSEPSSSDMSTHSSSESSTRTSADMSRTTSGEKLLATTPADNSPNSSSSSSIPSSSSESSDRSYGSDSERGFGFDMDLLEIEITGPGVDEETSKTNAESPRTRLCVEGQVVTGRLNIHRPADGPAKYYLNWCNRTHDNLIMDPEEMKKVFGDLRKLQVGMYFKVTVSEVPEDSKVHPKGKNAVCVPCPPNKVCKRRRHRHRRNLVKTNRHRRRSHTRRLHSRSVVKSFAVRPTTS